MNDQNTAPTPDDVLKLFREAQSGIAYAGTSEEHEKLSGFIDNVLKTGSIDSDNFIAMAMLLIKYLNRYGLGLEYIQREAHELLSNYEAATEKKPEYELKSACA